MSNPEPTIQLPLTAEQQELIHRLTGEHANVLELAPTRATGARAQGAGSASTGGSRWTRAFPGSNGVWAARCGVRRLTEARRPSTQASRWRA